MIINELKLQEQSLVVLVGNIGCGKTTVAEFLVLEGFVSVSRDSIEKSLNGGCQGILHGAKFCELVDYLYLHTINIAVDKKFSVVADFINITIKKRRDIINIAHMHDIPVIAIDFGKGDDISLERRQKSKYLNAQGFAFMHLDFQNQYQQPTKAEGFRTIIQAFI